MLFLFFPSLVMAIRKKGDSKEKLYTKGDTIDQAVIKSILREQVVLWVDGREETLSMKTRKSENNGPDQIPEPALVESSPVPARTEEGFVETIELSWDELNAMKKDIVSLRKQVRIRPHFYKNEMDGFRVTSIKKNSVFYQKFGLRNGDIVAGVDHQDIKSVGDASTFFNGFSKLNSDVDTDIRIKRNGKTGTLRYSIK